MTAAFAGQVALVTGAGGGIGGALVQALLERGATVVGADLKPPAAIPGRPFRGVALDVRRREDIRRVVDEVVATEGRLDVLVNVAGVVSHGPAESLAEEEWDRVIDINLKGTFLCCQAAMGAMKRQRYGRIVNIGSVVGRNGGNARPWIAASEQNVSSNVAYGASKAGVHSVTAYLSKELAPHGITVNAVAPGPIATAMTTAFPESLRQLIPVGRMGQLEDVVRAILFLAAKESSFVTGEVLDVNGGMWCD